jgi:hypothetical protein
MKYDALTFLEGLFRQTAEQAVGSGPEIRVEDLDPEWRVEWEERAAVLEYDGGHSREHAEALALSEIIGRMHTAGLPLRQRCLH